MQYPFMHANHDGRQPAALTRRPYRSRLLHAVRGIVLAAVLLVALGACAPMSETTVEPAVTAAAQSNENLHSVLWTQTAAEYDALTLQTYRAARRMLDSALTVPGWTAALEQVEDTGYESLPPAVILDVDETVLDNSAYQARLVRDDAQYDRSSWQAWVREEEATPIAGALDFTRYADRQGVAVFYLTNRRAAVEEATRANLARLGFPLDDEVDTVVMRGERPAWDTGDKTTRREVIVEDYRVLLMAGDNLGDFIGEVERSVEERAALAERYGDYWGTRWFVLPNAQYGSWEGALFDYDYGLSREERLQHKYEHLETQQ